MYDSFCVLYFWLTSFVLLEGLGGRGRGGEDT